MKIKSIVLLVMCMLMLVGCAEDSSSEKSQTTERTTTTATSEDISFEATVLGVSDSGHIDIIESDYVIDAANGEIGEAWLEYDDSIEVASDIKEGDKIKVTVWGDAIAMKESSPPIIYDIKSIEKLNTTTTAHEDISFEATVLDVTSEGYVHFADIDADLDGSGQKVGKARLDYDIDSVWVSDDIKNGDKVKITIGGEMGLGDSIPPVVFGIKKIEKIN